MKVLILNPNTTKAMTDSVLAVLKRKAPSSLEMVGMTATSGCAVIDSPQTCAIGAQTAMQMLAEAPSDFALVVLACFGDVGLSELRASSKVPVISLAQTAFDYVMNQKTKAAVITIGEQWGPMLYDYLARLQVPADLIDIHTLPGNGKKLIEDPQGFRHRVLEQSKIAAEQGARLLFLGGAAFADMKFEVDPRLTLVDTLDLIALELTRMQEH